MKKRIGVPTLTESTAALPNLETIIRGLLCVYIFSLPFKDLLFVERNGFIRHKIALMTAAASTAGVTLGAVLLFLHTGAMSAIMIWRIFYGPPSPVRLSYTA
jgi:hypothetical protein